MKEFNFPTSETMEIFASEAATRGVLCKKVFLQISQNSQENTCARVSFLIKFKKRDIKKNLLKKSKKSIKKETLAQVFSCEFCEVSKNTFFTEQLWTTASVSYPSSTMNVHSCQRPSITNQNENK